MTKSRNPAGGAGKGAKSGERPSPAEGPRRRWVTVLAIVVCVAVGFVVLEFLSRPPEMTLERRAALERKQAQAEVPPAEAPIPVPQTVEGLVAEGAHAASELAAAFPQSTEALLTAGYIHEKLGQTPEAIACWERCLQVDPGSVDACFRIGSAIWEADEFAKAVPYLEKTCKMNPRLTRARVLLGHALLNLGKPQEAIAVLEQDRESIARMPQALAVLGHSYLQLRQYEKAKSNFEAAVAIDPRFKLAQYGLATVLARMGQPEKAKQHKEAFLKMDEEAKEREPAVRAGVHQWELKNVRQFVAEVYVSAGQIYAKHSRIEEASRMWARANAIDPEHDRVRQSPGSQR